ncbi:MAG TPA: hypothetical protein VLX92_05965 [Kofleriaceae bacterium]|nr:hypothetical protein [Kofleriaceae bacterium]
MRALVVVVLLCAGIASARPPALTPYDAGKFTVSLPAGWTVQLDAAKGLVVAQQDGKRPDAPQVLVVVVPSTTVTADQLLDAATGQAVQGLTVVHRDALPGGGGTQLVADGVAGGVRVRIGAVVVGANGGLMLGLVAAKRGDFDALGGTGLVMSILGSVRASGADSAPAAAAAPAAAGGDAVMTPTYDYYHNLIIPPPQRQIGPSDLVGEWTNDAKAISTYASRVTGQYAGYDAVVSNEVWNIDARGNLSTKYHGVAVGTGYVHPVDDSHKATIAIAPDGVITIRRSDNPHHPVLYLLRGWFVGQDVVMMKINGPYYDTIPDNVRPADKAINLNSVWVRRRVK